MANEADGTSPLVEALKRTGRRATGYSLSEIRDQLDLPWSNTRFKSELHREISSGNVAKSRQEPLGLSGEPRRITLWLVGAARMS